METYSQRMFVTKMNRLYHYIVQLFHFSYDINSVGLELNCFRLALRSTYFCFIRDAILSMSDKLFKASKVFSTSLQNHEKIINYIKPIILFNNWISDYQNNCPAIIIFIYIIVSTETYDWFSSNNALFSKCFYNN